MTRRYTGFDGIGRRRPGVELFAAEVPRYTGARLWNNGTFGIRPVRGGTRPSVHSTGRAVDLSHRPMGDGKRIGCSPAEAWAIIDRFVAAADDLELEAVGDYRPPRRWWRCDRGTWSSPAAIVGVPDTIHLEFSPAISDDPDRMRSVLADLFGAPDPDAPPRYPGRPLKLGSSGLSVERIQRRLAELGFDPGLPDGKFGPRTELAVVAFQADAQIEIDGIVGPITWRALFG